MWGYAVLHPGKNAKNHTTGECNDVECRVVVWDMWNGSCSCWMIEFWREKIIIFPPFFSLITDFFSGDPVRLLTWLNNKLSSRKTGGVCSSSSFWLHS